MPDRRLLIPVLVAFAVALAVRLALLACVAPALRVSEFADDALYYRVLINDPTMLITGRVVPDMEGGVIYAPLMPFGISFPGRWLADAFGFSIGQRLGMILYDSLAVTLALGIAWHATAPPKGFREWAFALALTAVPGSALASAVWGQEDALAAAWAALCLLAVVKRRPVLAASIAAFGLLTIKLFAILLVVGIWLGTPGRRWRITVAAALQVLLLIGFLAVRWYISGLPVPRPTYIGLFNSPSPYAAYYYLVRPISFSDVEFIVMALTALALGVVTWLSLRTTPTVPAAVVTVHAAFFLTFIGIQPEHHEWFMPFMLIVAWSAWREGRVALPIAAWALSLFAYGFKIAYGLQGGTSASSAGKAMYREWARKHLAIDLFQVQMAFLFLTLVTAALVCVLSFRFGVQQRRREVDQSAGTRPAESRGAAPLSSLT
jgi:hypothetical protein